MNETPGDWLERQFEFEFCDECGGDAEDHEVCIVPGTGTYFARCLRPPREGGEPPRPDSGSPQSPLKSSRSRVLPPFQAREGEALARRGPAMPDRLYQSGSLEGFHSTISTVRMLACDFVDSLVLRLDRRHRGDEIRASPNEIHIKYNL